MPAGGSPRPPWQIALGALIFLAKEVVTGAVTQQGQAGWGLCFSGDGWGGPEGHTREAPSQGALPGQPVCPPQPRAAWGSLQSIGAVFC